MNLTDQLRASRDQWHGFGVIDPAVIDAAADRIEALEAALAQVMDHLEVNEEDASYVIAREALGEATDA